MPNSRKHFVLDTNVLLHSPAALESFRDNHVIIPIDVIEELVRFKSRPGELGANARECIRRLDHFCTLGHLTEGVQINDAGGTLRIDFKSMCLLDHGLSADIPDHRIISVAYRLMCEGHKAVFVSKDVNLRIKSDVLKVETEGKDIGYLPGSVAEKLEPWMKPIFDNLQFILRSKGRNPVEAKKQVNELIQNGAIEMEALTYIRGRSIHHQYLIIDECQNLTPHEVKTIISRAGHGTKIILTGDPYQIDNPDLDAETNGLAFVCERMKNLPLSGHVVLQKTERSQLASLAADYL
jgi:predicted ribonuclease YlaK